MVRLQSNLVALLVVAVLSSFLIVTKGFAQSNVVPTTFDWGSYTSSTPFSLTYGVYDTDTTTILQTGDLAQLIWAGPDGVIQPPLGRPGQEGNPGGDDVLLDMNRIQNGAPLPPTLRNKGYIPNDTYTFDTESPQSGGLVYIRAWNSYTPTIGDYWNESPFLGTLTPGGRLNSRRWAMIQGPLAVVLESFTATPMSDYILVAWETATEVNNLGFNLYRNTELSVPDEPLNEEMIPSQAPGSGQGFIYEWEDRDVASGTTYYYWLEDVDLDGTRTLHGPVSATLGAPTAVVFDNLKLESGSPIVASLLGTVLALGIVGYILHRRYLK